MPQYPQIPRYRPRTEPPDPAPVKLKRKRCLNCGRLFPLTKESRKFCKDECRKEFHRYGAAYGPLRQGLEKLIERTTREQYRELKQSVQQLSKRIDRLTRDILELGARTLPEEPAEMVPLWPLRTD